MLTTVISRKWVGKHPLHISLHCFVCMNTFITRAKKETKNSQVELA